VIRVAANPVKIVFSFLSHSALQTRNNSSTKMITIHVPSNDKDSIINKIESTGLEFTGIDLDFSKYNIELLGNKTNIRVTKKLSDVATASTRYELKKYNFNYAKLQSATINGKSLDKPSFRGTALEIYKSIGSFDKIKPITTANIERGKRSDKGYTYYKDMDFSIQPQVTSAAIRETLNMANAYDIQLNMVIQLKSGELINVVNNKLPLQISQQLSQPSEHTQIAVQEDEPITEVTSPTAKSDKSYIMSLQDLNNYDFTDSKVISTKLQQTEISNPNFRNVRFGVYGIIGADKALAQTSGGIKKGQYTKSGYSYVKSVDISCQSKNSQASAREILNMALINQIELDMVIQVKDGTNVKIVNQLQPVNTPTLSLTTPDTLNTPLSITKPKVMTQSSYV